MKNIVSVLFFVTVLYLGQFYSTSAQSSLTGNSQDRINNPPVMSSEIPALSSDSLSILTKQYEESIKLERSGLRKKVGGSILLFAGTPIFIIGGAIIAATSVKDTVEENMFGTGTYETTTPNRTGQAIGFTIGVAGGVTCLLVGVIQRTIGKAILTKARYQKKIIAPKLKASGNSVSLIFNF